MGGIPLIRKPKIVSLLENPDIKKAIGSFYLRHYLPFTHPVFQDKFDFSTITIAKALNSDADILVASRVAVPDEGTALRLLEYCRKNNIKTVYETDDHLFGLPAWETNSCHYAHTLPAAKIFAENSNMMIVSSDALKEQYREWNERIITAPNTLDERLWSPPANMMTGHQGRSRIRILYMGTSTHLNDLLIVENAIKKLSHKWGDKVAFDVIGITRDQNTMDWINPIPVPNSNYVEFVKWLCKANCWSIGIAPLEKTEFNRCKSYIKYIDYAALGLVPVCTDFSPYQDVIRNGENGILVENDTQSWFNALDGLIADHERLGQLAENAYQDFLTHHQLKTQVTHWIKAFEGLVETN